MHLWSEYEGKTIAGAYHLKKLLRSEGRNAFFTTSDEQKSSAVIRLTEAHFDEEEMLKRWRQVAAVDQHYLLAIRKVGQTNVDDIAVAYALLEPSDANLDEVLRERPLTPAETLQVANSVVSALSTLHANGLVHEHVQPSNVLAVGETVKLRSDCVRECVADQEFTSSEKCEELRLRDVHDLGLLLLRCLTLETEWTPAQKLVAPFTQIIPGALDGSWSLERIASVLEPAIGAANETASGKGAQNPEPTPGQNLGRKDPQTRLVPVELLQTNLNISASRTAPAKADRTPYKAKDLPGVPRQVISTEHQRTASKWMFPLLALILALTVALLFGWHFAGNRAVRPTTAGPSPRMAAAPPQSINSAAERQVAGPVTTTKATAGWYVVAYTYNHNDQAQAKVIRLRKRHNSLQPRVFSPSGQAPFLVTLGGPMSNQQAGAMLRRARRSGMPRDTFIRNY